MGRLTDKDWKNPQSTMWAKVDLHIKNPHYNVGVSRALQKLAEYEDLEEAGRLYVLACGIEKPLYALIPQLDWKDSHLKAKWRISTVVPRNVEECLLWEDDMKRGMAFITEEDALAKLKELEGDKE